MMKHIPFKTPLNWNDATLHPQTKKKIKNLSLTKNNCYLFSGPSGT
ncbi:MAG: hypothetical protein ACWA45_08840 [Flavobacteriales bacterium]